MIFERVAEVREGTTWEESKCAREGKGIIQRQGGRDSPSSGLGPIIRFPLPELA